MKVKRHFCMVLACLLLTASISVPASAAETGTESSGIFTVNAITPRATGSFNMTIPANSQTRANSSFPMMAGETVTIKASYAPFSATVDFGLIGPDGTYYYFTITNGSIDKTILIEDNGDYTLQVRNRSSIEVEVSGFVNY